MILVKKTGIIIFIVLMAVLLIIISSYSYFIITKAASFSPEKLKFLAENIFLFGLSFSIIVLFAGIGTILRSYLFGKALDKILIMSRNTGHSPDLGLRKLGKIGTQIADILLEMNSISEKRALRISSLHNLVKKIIDNSDMTASVVTASGEIVFSTLKFAEKFEAEPEELAGHSIDVFIKDREIKEMISAAAESRKEISMDDGTIYPVVTSSNETVWCLCVFNTIPRGVSFRTIKESTALRSIMEKGGRIKNAFDFLRKKK